MESYPRQCRVPDGETFTENIGNELEKDDLITKRPYLGKEYIHASEYHELIGKTAKRHIYIDELIKRIKNSNPSVKEIIFALSPSTEGDTTFLYIERMIKPLNIKTSRLARGLSLGSDLEYIDESTLSSAFRGRR